MTPILFLKAEQVRVEGHIRHAADGRPVLVRPYQARRETAGQLDLFSAPTAAPVERPAQADAPPAGMVKVPDDAPPGADAPQDEPNLASYDHFVVGFSGGKDSIAAVLHLIERGVPPEKIELHHHDIDARGPAFMDWASTPAYVRAFGQALGVPVYFSFREGGFEREMMRDQQATAPVRFETPEGELRSAGGKGPEGTRKKFPQVSGDLKVRWCSGALKIDVMAAALRNQDRFTGKRTLVVTGERAEESPQRSRYKKLEPHRTTTNTRHVDHWRPVHGWPEQDVWAIMQRHGVVPHPAYQMGWGRLSCMTCIFGDPDQWATIRAVFPDRFQKIADREREIGLTIRHKASVEETADRGTPYPEALANPELAAEEAAGRFTGPILVPPEQWKLPAGAYRHSAGPS